MTWSLFDLFRRRLCKATRPATAKRKAPARRAQPWLELLEDRSVPSAVTISSSFNATAVPAGDTLWLSSVLNGVSGVGSSPATITVTNQTVSFTDSYAGTVNVTLPNAVITLTPGGTSATTTFDTTNNQWVSNDPTGVSGNLFVSGYALALPSGLRGSDKPVTWTATFSTDTSGIKFNWAWAAAAYSRFSTDYTTIGVKPTDNSTISSYKNSDKAGAPETYKYYDVGGGTGGGGTNYTGNFSPNTAVTPAYTPTFVSVSGVVYSDNNSSGIYDSGDSGIGGVVLNLTGTTTGGQAVTATTTTASDGTYSFTTDTNGNCLVAGTYQVTEAAPAGYYQGTNTVGTDSGNVDGTLGAGNTINSIVLNAGDSAVNYNFGNINPFTQVSPAYPYSSSNPLTNIAFNESEVLAGATVNVANGTLNMFYTDEHAMALGVRETDIKVLGTITKNSTTVSITTGGTDGFAAGQAISGSGIPTGTTITAVNASTSTITLSNAATASATKVALTVVQATYPVSPLTADPSSAVNPAVGNTTTTGSYAAVDASGRPIFPSLYVTDITANPNSTSGDWQFGGTAIPPSALYGSWKPFVSLIDRTVSTPTNTAVADPDPAANGWNLGPGADAVPSGLTNAGYGTEIQWSLNSLYSQGLLIPGHNYRFYFIVHDGDQNKTGGDCGQAAYQFTYQGPTTISGYVYNDANGNHAYSSGDVGIGGVTLQLTGTTFSGASITATTVTAADGSYTFTTDSTGQPLQGGTYTITEVQPGGYLQGTNTVGTVSGNWQQNFQTALAGTDTSGTGSVGYTHDVVNSTADNIFSGGSTKDVNGINGWLWTNQQTQPKDDIADVFGAYFTDSTDNHKMLLASVDRFGNSGNSTIGYWALQSPFSMNPNGTFNGVHTNGDVLLVMDFASAAVTVYQWQGSDATGQLVQITPPAYATYTFVNSSPVAVPWAFRDSAGYTSPQSGEFMKMALDLTSTFGLAAPVFTGFVAETRSSNSPSSTLSDFAFGQFNAIAGASQADGTLIPVDKIGTIVLNSGQSGINYNFGEVLPVTLSGQVYHDVNGNNALDSGEPGLSGVTVTLTGTNDQGTSVTATTTTTSSGAYSFTTDSSGNKLRPGTYTITETQPTGYLLGAAAVGTVNGTADGTAASATTLSNITLTSGQNGSNYLFGDVKAVSLNGTVYQDSNGNNRLDSGEPGLAGVTLTLSGTNNLGQPITATTTTGTGGTYSFTTDSQGNALRPGTYTITETVPTGYLTGAAALGTVNGAADGTVTSATTLSSIALTSGQSGVNYNFGDVQPVSLGGLVYTDTNGNGKLDSGETGLGGVTLTLSGTNGLNQPVSVTVTTIANAALGTVGSYSFTQDASGNQLRPGSYTITETLPNGYVASGATVGTVNGVTIGTLSSATRLSSIALTSGQSGVNYNFGDVQPITLGGMVYHDANDNGILDNAETGIAGVTVALSGTNGLGQQVNATTTTGAGGVYLFATDSQGKSLLPGTYTITETQPAGYVSGSTNVGSLGGTSVAFGTIGSIVTTSGQAGSNYNFGEVKAVSVSGLVYTDTADTGVYNAANDPGLAGATLTLSGTNDRNQAITATLTTGTGGSFNFTTDSSGNLLRPGTYTITETQPTGYLAGSTTVGTVNGTTDGTVVASRQVGSIVLADSNIGVNYLFGEFQPVTLSGKVYTDSNADGVFDTGDTGISGVTLTLTGTNGLNQSVSLTTTTDTNGNYSFPIQANTLRPGTYTITETAPSGYIAGTTSIGTVNGSQDGTVVASGTIGSIVVTSGQAGSDYDFGHYQPVTIAGEVYRDPNGSGTFSASDTGFPGVTVTLSGTNGQGQPVTATTLTDTNGLYSFSQDSNGNPLIPGTYTITSGTPTGFVAVAANVGTINGTTVGNETSPTQISAVVLASGQNGINYDFGASLPASLSGTVYIDNNSDGVFDSGDTGYQFGATVVLTGTTAAGLSVNLTTTTDQNGFYIFANLAAGTYNVTLEPPGGTYLTEVANVGDVNGTTTGTLNTGNPGMEIDGVFLSLGNVGENYNFGGTFNSGLPS